MLGDSFPDVLAGVREGRSASAVLMYNDLQPVLLRYLRSVTPRNAEDVASDTWVEIVRRIDRFEGDESGFRSWVFTIARSKSVDQARRAKVRSTVELDPEQHDAADSDDDPAELVSSAAATQEIIAMIALLPRDQAEAVSLRVVAGLDVAEVAKIMNRSPGAVRVLSHRGLKRLAERLAGRSPSGEV